MSIAVVGATGTAGALTAAHADRAGQEPVALSRATGVDLHNGRGLAEALSGSTVAIDTSNPFPADPGADLVDALAGATGNLVQACLNAGVEHLVFLSICNIDAPVFDEFPYYRAKRAQERVVVESELPSTIVRSTQWYEFVTNPAAVTFHEDRVDVEDWLIQPVAADTVARVLLEASIERPETRQVAGPEQIRLPELTAAYLKAKSDTRPVDSVPPGLARLGEGVLLAPDQADRSGPNTREWLAHVRG